MSELTVKDKVENLFEDMRRGLVSLLGDIRGVHATIDDAKTAIKFHVPEEVVPVADTKGAEEVQVVPVQAQQAEPVVPTPVESSEGGEGKPAEGEQP